MSRSTEKSIFLDALDIESLAHRSEFLRTACQGDDRLRAAVDGLLHAHELTDNPLDAPLIDFDATFNQTSIAGSSGAATLDFPPASNLLNQEVGPYRLMEQIGEGGFGLVFVAEQLRPVRRKVALKLIKPGMDSREVIARFEAERQALALMDHPNIAQVYDAGTSSDGRPYFVMELVRGIPINEFCDRHKLRTTQRLELFVTVCRAVQHAHQKGIIHRDLKPSNILVTLHDGLPVAKVIDFGVAKAIGQSMTDKTIYTRFTAMIGTPLYMSPEQAELTGQDVDTRSDIYSLGVVLYELLTGSTPFDNKRLQRAGLDEMRRIIREEEPPRPSTRLSTLGEALSTVSATRGIEQFRLPGLIRGDLDWIVMKAMDKVRSRRYESANGLAADLQRFLLDEPVEARQPSAAYRFRKFARRHRVLLTTVSLVATALIIGTAVSTWQAVRATTERNQKTRALEDAMIARQEADQAKQQVEEFNDHLTEATSLTSSGGVHANSGNWSEANADYTRATELLPDYFLVWNERGSFFVDVGLWDQAAQDYSKALRLGAVPTGPNWWGVPQLFVYQGQSNQYQEVCAQILSRTKSMEDLSTAELRALVLAPHPQLETDLLIQHANELALQTQDRRRDRRNPGRGSRLGSRRGPAAEPPSGPPRDDGGPDRRGSPPMGRSWPPRGSMSGRQPVGAKLYIAGLTYYRAKQYENAIELLVQADQDDPGWPGQGLSYPVLALAYYDSHQDELAKQALKDAKRKYDTWAEQISQSSVGSMPIPWFDWVEFVVLYREATKLITGEFPPDSPLLEQVEQRALAAITGNPVTVP